MSSINPFIYNPLMPNVGSKGLDNRIKQLGKRGEDAIVSVNVTIREEKAQDAKQALQEALAHIDREYGGNYNG